MNSDPSPQAVAAYVIGLVLAIPTLVVIIRAIWFVAAAHATLNATAKGVDELKTSFGNFKHEARNQLDEQDKRLFLVEREVERLKESA